VAINKANSPTWVKVTLIVLIVAFVASFVVIAANPFGGGAPGTTGETTGTAGPASASDTQFQGQVASLTAQLQGDPTNYGTLVSLGNAYFDWAATKQQEIQGSQSQAGADLPLWIAAKDAYSRAIAIDGTQSPVLVDYAITAFYTGDTTTAIATAEQVVASDPTFSPAPFNLGIFYQGLGDNAKALAAFEKYLEVDPTGKTGGNPDFAKQQVEALKSDGGTTTAP